MLTISFALAVFFGAHLTMKADMNGGMVSCPILGEVGNICPMNASQHIAAWQQLFLAVVSFVGLALLFAAAKYIRIFDPIAISSYSGFTKKRDKPGDALRNYLLKTFGSGIFHKRE